MTYFRVESKPTFRDLAGRFVKANQELSNIRRDEMKTLENQFIDLASEEAPGGPGHSVARGLKRRDLSGRFSSASSTSADGAIGFGVTPGKLGAWHIQGTGIYGPRGRLIVPVRAAALRFVINGEVLFRKWVRGIKPNPFFERAHKRWLPLTRKALRRISTRWTEELT